MRLIAREHLGRYRNTWDCLHKVLAQEGPSALACGLGPTMWRNTVRRVQRGVTHMHGRGCTAGP